TNYQRFINLIQSAGFINRKLISSKGSLNFAYALYLNLRSKGMDEPQIQNLVKRWFVLSILTGRYSGSSESAIERDSKQILEKGIEAYLNQIEQAELDDGFWNYRIVNDLDSSSTVNNAYLCYLASQCKNNESAFLSESMSVRNLLEQSSNGNVHHIFPKNYLTQNGFKKSDYNQVANYTFTEQQSNIKLGNLAPKDYMAKVHTELAQSKNECTSLKDVDALKANMLLNCIPESLDTSDYTHYNEFLSQRRQLMAQKIRAFYRSL
ncbi:MAG: hypothetical protein E6Q25_09205, partial [Acinetobacter sp.]